MLNRNLKKLTRHQLLLIVRQLENVVGDQSHLMHEVFEIIKPNVDEIVQDLLRDFALSSREGDSEEAQWHLDTIDSLAWLVDSATYGKGL